MQSEFLLLHKQVSESIRAHGLIAEELACDPEYADTAAFNEQYNLPADQGANTLLIASKKVEPPVYVICVILSSMKCDVNKAVTRNLGVKKASFADAETTKRLTGMEIGGVTCVGIIDIPIFIDAEVLKREYIIMGGGNRTSKLRLNPHELIKLPNVKVVDYLAI